MSWQIGLGSQGGVVLGDDVCEPLPPVFLRVCQPSQSVGFEPVSDHPTGDDGRDCGGGLCAAEHSRQLGGDL